MHAGSTTDFKFGSTIGFRLFGTGALQVAAGSGWTYGWSSNADPSQAALDTATSRVAAGVIGIGTGAAQNVGGWFNYGGQARVSADFSVTSSVALTNVTGLSIALLANRHYEFEVYLHCTDAAAGGVQAAITVPTGATVIYDGYTLDANAIKGQTRATASGTAVGSTTTTGTTPFIYIKGEVDVAGTAGNLVVQFAQNTSNATASIVKSGSIMRINDTP